MFLFVPLSGSTEWACSPSHWWCTWGSDRGTQDSYQWSTLPHPGASEGILFHSPQTQLSGFPGSPYCKLQIPSLFHGTGDCNTLVLLCMLVPYIYTHIYKGLHECHGYGSDGGKATKSHGNSFSWYATTRCLCSGLEPPSLPIRYPWVKKVSHIPAGIYGDF